MTIKKFGREAAKWNSDESTETFLQMSSIVEITIRNDFSDAKRIEVSIVRGTKDGLWHGEVQVWFNDCLGCRGFEHGYRCPEDPINKRKKAEQT